MASEALDRLHFEILMYSTANQDVNEEELIRILSRYPEGCCISDLHEHLQEFLALSAGAIPLEVIVQVACYKKFVYKKEDLYFVSSRVDDMPIPMGSLHRSSYRGMVAEVLFKAKGEFLTVPQIVKQTKLSTKTALGALLALNGIPKRGKDGVSRRYVLRRHSGNTSVFSWSGLFSTPFSDPDHPHHLKKDNISNSVLALLLMKELCSSGIAKATDRIAMEKAEISSLSSVLNILLKAEKSDEAIS